MARRSPRKRERGFRLLIATVIEEGASVSPDAVANYGLRLLVVTAIEGDTSVPPDAVANYGLRLFIATAIEDDASVPARGRSFLKSFPEKYP